MGQAMGVGVAGLLIAHVGAAALLVGGALGLLAVALHFSHRVRLK